jgi:predicted TIM-barrel fold metal-dependent hydrolase
MGGRRGGQAGVPLIDTHAFAFSPAFLEDSRLPQDIDGTLATLVKDMAEAGVARTLATFFVTRHDDTFGSVAEGLARYRGKVAAQLYLAVNHPNYAASNAFAAARDPAVGGARAAPSLFRLHPVDESLEKVWDGCEQSRLPVQIVVDASKYCEPSTLAILARQRPELPLVLSIGRGRHRAGLARLARYPRVYFQLPGLLDGEVAAGDPALLRWAVRALPRHRLMFGSDRLGRERSYFAKVEEIRALPSPAREAIAWQTAAEVYGERLPAWRAP